MIESRKEDHIEICLNEDVELEESYWDMLRFYHNALPEVNLEEISLKTKFLGKDIDAPIMIAAITGGFSGAKNINRQLAEVAEELQIPMGVGSQRAALENDELRESYEVIKEYDIPIVFSNIGAPQLISQEEKTPFGIEELEESLKMIGGHYVAVHFNFLQEIIQPEGDHRARGILDTITDICEELPIVAKETGAGISSDIAVKLERAGVKAIDVGGMGGTSFSAVEYYRTKDSEKRELAEKLWDWGIPTPVSVIECKRSVDLPIIATGGVRSGVHTAKALALGADMTGIAGGILPYISEGKEETKKYIEKKIEGLKATMFLLGCRDINDLKSEKMIITNNLRDWLEI